MSTNFQEGDFVLRFDAPSERLDDPARSRPQGLSLVDFVVDEPTQLLLVEVKDPSAPSIPPRHRTAQADEFARKIEGDALIAAELVPKARDSYCFLHLMRRDNKPMVYVVLLGLRGYSNEPALLLGFKERLLRRLRHEADQPWKRQYVKDCIVLTETLWPGALPQHRLSRVSSAGSSSP